jgi:hypothetical protein
MISTTQIKNWHGYTTPEERLEKDQLIYCINWIKEMLEERLDQTTNEINRIRMNLNEEKFFGEKHKNILIGESMRADQEYKWLLKLCKKL